MSHSLQGTPFWQLTFDRTGALTSDDGLLAEAGPQGVTDLFVFSHGWNTGAQAAENLYERWFPLIGAAAAQALPAGRRIGYVGIFWPSVLFPTQLAAGTPDTRDAVLSAAAVPSGSAVAAALAPAFDAAQQPVLARLGQLVDQQPSDGAALSEFQQLLGRLATSTPGMAVEDSGEQQVLSGRPAAVFGTLSSMSASNAGDAEGIGDVFKTMWHGAIEAWRTTSFFEMKGRAGAVGQQGLGPLISKLAAALPNLRMHLAGHSFGWRLVAFALAGLGAGEVGSASPVKSLALVQGAFSHYSFTDPLPWAGRGALAGMQSRVDGPLLATFSAKDRALGWWYPTASLLSHSDSESVVDLTKRWMAMGADGYQAAGTTQLPLGPAGQQYAFAKGAFYSLDANDVIANMVDPFQGAHSDIVHPEVAWAIVSAAG